MTKDNDYKRINARVMKWRQMLKKGVHTDKELLIKRTRKGIPPAIRQQVWPQLIRIQKFKQKTPQTYSMVLLKDSYDTYDINLDIPRTFSFQSQEVLRSSLFNVLKSLSIEFPLIGYCQGMNFLSMRLLEIMNDETVYYMLVFLIRKYKSLYDNFRNPGFVNKMNAVFQTLLERHLPKVYAKLKSQDIQPLMYTTSWFLTLFSKTLESEKFYRFFQCLLVEGYVVIYKTALALMKIKQKIIQQQSLEENLSFVTNFQFYENIPNEEFIQIMCSFSLDVQQIIKLQQEYTSKNKASLKTLQQSVQTAYKRKKYEPRNVIEWNLDDFKKSQYQFVDFQ